MLAVNLSASTSYSRLVYSDTNGSTWTVKTFVAVVPGGQTIKAAIQIGGSWFPDSSWSSSSNVKAVGTNRTHFNIHKHGYLEKSNPNKYQAVR